jgi:hypothetical protein
MRENNLYVGISAMKQKSLPLIILLLGTACLGQSTITPLSVNDFVNPGQRLTLSVEPPPVTAPKATLHPLGSGNDVVVQTNVRDDKKTIDITLPDRLKPGRYYLTLDDGNKLVAAIVPGEVRVQANVEIDSAHPSTAYRDRATNKFNFDVVGQNFSSLASDNRVYIDGQGQIIDSYADSQKSCQKDSSKTCLWIEPPEKPEKLHILNYAGEHYQGPLQLSVGVGSGRSEKKPLVLSRMSETGVLIWTIVVFSALALIIYRLVSTGIKTQIIGGERYSPFWAFFLDGQTNSYSLSKFQLFLLSSAFVFGYLYVLLCQWLVQWHFELPDVPSNVAGLLAISAGTTVTAAVATGALGSKGAGRLRPSAADFISIGGQVVPERFQFFVWTLVGCFGFITLLISQNPATITGVPKIPDGLLYVMGISATGYLAGKVGRKPGPVVRNTALAKDTKTQTPILIVQGENLSSDADFSIDGKKLPIDGEKKHVTATPQDQLSNQKFSSELRIEIGSAADLKNLDKGDHRFRITNPDAQFAESTFTADQPSITAISDTSPPPVGVKQIKTGNQIKTVYILGKGFRGSMSATWLPANATEAQEQIVKYVDENNVTVDLVPGPPGTATITLCAPSGFSAADSVTVIK